jgi:hypothetical protein
MKKPLHIAALALSGLLAAGTAWAECESSTPANDYPTAARADYVFGCMAANGQTEEVLRKCSCSVDIIASLLPYVRYEQVETIMRIRLMPGQRSAGFRDAPWATALVDELKRAQAESTLRCF